MSDCYRVCSTCKKPIPFNATYFLCSVSTCNRKRIGLFFCSVPCWDAHLPEARHRDAWAVQETAPSKQEWERQQKEEEARAAEAERREAAGTTATQPEATGVVRRRVVGSEESSALSNDNLPSDVLIVVSKLKKYVRARSGMNTSDNVFDALSDHLRKLCDKAIVHAAQDERKTVMKRDFLPVIEKLGL